MPLIQSNGDAINDLKYKTEKLIYPSINYSSQSIDFILNQRATTTNKGNVKVSSMTAHNISLVDSREKSIVELEAKQKPLGKLDS